MNGKSRAKAPGATAVNIHGAEYLSPAELEAELAAGGRVVYYEFCISFLILTLRCPTGLYLLYPEEYGFSRGMPYTVLTFFLGWWGVPMGILYTPVVMLGNLLGGRDVTDEVRAALAAPQDLVE
jgi:hypothetical protein